MRLVPSVLSYKLIIRHRAFLPTREDSIFNSGSAAWDQIFDGLTDEPTKTTSDDKSAGPPSRRQGITARETKVLTGMLDMIFDSTNANQRQKPVGEGEGEEEEQFGFRRGRVDDFFGRLRRHSRPGKLMDDLDASLLDQKKEQISFCNSDQELLDWAIREVFEESKQYEATARLVIADAAKTPGKKVAPRLQPATYPHMIALLMRTFRDKYHDPHLALSIFNYAKSLSIVSYVFGCSTEAYNELVQTKWECFRDLRGVHDAIHEMIVNGVRVNTGTRKWVENVRRDVLNQKVPLDISDTGQNEVWQLLTKIELILANSDAQQGSKARWDNWKAEVVNDDNPDDDRWGFDNWDQMFHDKRPSRRGLMKPEDILLSA